MNTYILSTLLFVHALALSAQQEVKVTVEHLDLYGTLLTPAKKTNKAILIISGSGTTDRDGNTKPMYTNDGLRKLAEELTELGFATVRFDKRGVGKSVSASTTAEELRFEHLISDASAWIAFLKDRYEDITVIGHSQGALVGMVAIQHNEVNRFISLAGLSEDAYTTVKRQLANQPKVVVDAAYPLLDSLKNGFKVKNIPPYLNSLFNPKTQDYFMSFMKFDPREEIKKVNCPVLVIQGTTDLQITVEGATEMSRNASKPSLKIIEGMNHVLRTSPINVNANMATYNNPTLPLHPDLVGIIKEFLGK
jgi:alpha-beta hydrolase superfamily lysophospholipase